MAKKIMFVVGLMLILAQPVKVFAQSSEENQVTINPPPVSNANIHKSVQEWKGTMLYFSSSSDDFDISAYGGAMDFLSGISDRFGWNGIVTLMGLSGEFSGDFSMDIDGLFMSVGGNILYEILEGEQKDAAGEITKISWGLTLYAGLTWSIGTFSISGDDAWGEIEGDISNSELSGMVGLVGQIPLGKRLQIIPYVGYNSMFAGTQSYDITTTMTIDYGFGPETYEISSSGSEDIDSYSYPIYGADIVLRPFRNNPNWKISLGTVLAQISANDGDNLMIMLGVTYEKGKHYSETMFGPVVR